MTVRKRTRTTGGAAADAFETETIVLEDIAPDKADSAIQSDEWVKRAEKLEKDVREVLSRTALAMTDARVALDKAEHAAENYEAVVEKVDKVIEWAEGVQGEQDEFREMLGNLEPVIGDSSMKVDRISERFADLDKLVEEMRTMMTAMKAWRDDAAGRRLQDAREIDKKFADFHKSFEERLRHTSQELRAHLEELKHEQPQRVPGMAAAAEESALPPEFESPPATSELAFDLNDILQVIVKHDTPDLHLKVGVPPTVRLGGELIPVGNQSLTERDCRRLILSPMSRNQRRMLSEGKGVNFTYVHDKVRFRINAFLQKGSVSAAIKMLRSKVPTADELGLPVALGTLALQTSGLVIVTGPAGCGKSSTVAAIVHHINSGRKAHILTIEEPIKFIHDDIQSIVTQREVGSDTSSYQEALDQALRLDPDVIFVGELRDSATMMAAVKAAETGRLVLATMYTPNTIQTLMRLVNSFDGAEQRQFCHVLGATLRGVISQKLLNKADESGKVPAVEFLKVTPEISALIRESRIGDIYPYLVDDSEADMRTFAVSVTELFDGGLITRAEMEVHTERIGEGRPRLRRYGAREIAPAPTVDERVEEIRAAHYQESYAPVAPEEEEYPEEEPEEEPQYAIAVETPQPVAYAQEFQTLEEEPYVDDFMAVAEPTPAAAPSVTPHPQEVAAAAGAWSGLSPQDIILSTIDAGQPRAAHMGEVRAQRVPAMPPPAAPKLPPPVAPRKAPADNAAAESTILDWL